MQFESDFDYEKLNRLFIANGKSNELILNDQIKSIAELVLDNANGHLTLGRFTNYVSLKESFDMALAFFEEINPTYAYQFQNIMNERRTKKMEDVFIEGKPTVSVRLIDETQQEKNGVSYRGNVYLSLNGDISDVRTIVHEFIHKFSHPYDYGNLFRFYLSEVPSIALEFVLYDYLCQSKEQYMKDCKEAMKLRFKNGIDSALVIWSECELYRLYKEYGEINEAALRAHYSKLCESKTTKNDLALFQAMLKYMRLIVKKGALLKIQNIRHLIGFVMATDFYSKFKRDTNVLETIFKLNDILGNSNDTLLEDGKVLNSSGFGVFRKLEDLGFDLEGLSDFGNPLRFDEDTLKRYSISFCEVYSEFCDEAKTMEDNSKKQ